MLLTGIIAVAIAALVGLGWKKLLAFQVRNHRAYPDRRITWREYFIALMPIGIIAVLVLWGGSALAVDQRLKYEELYNGVETAAYSHKTECHPGTSSSYSATSGLSNCAYSYQSGSYVYGEEYPVTSCSSDGKGGVSCTTTMVCCNYYTAPIYTPYAASEDTFSLNDSLGGSYTFPTVYVAPETSPYLPNVAIPGNVPRGAPSDWVIARQRLDAGDPRPVTRLFEYDNYILASGDEMLAPFKGDMQSYLDKGLLPEHTANIMSYPIYGDSRALAKKLSFVGTSVPNEAEWQEALMRFNAALGSKLQGDLHVVIADSQLVGEPRRYLNALRAYWLGEHFGRRALAKNGIILVIGTSGGKIDWAQADTGMPYGNNTMLRTMENLLIDQPLDPNLVFGNPRTVISKTGNDTKVNISFSTPQSALETAMFGEATKFKRPCMKCEDAEDAGGVGYKDLIAKIEPSFWEKFWMAAIIMALSNAIWALMAFTVFLEGKNDPAPSRYANRSRRHYPYGY